MKGTPLGIGGSIRCPAALNGVSFQSLGVHRIDLSFRNQIIMQLVLYAMGIASLLYVNTIYVKQTNHLIEEGVNVPTDAEQNLSEVQGIEHTDEPGRGD